MSIQSALIEFDERNIINLCGYNDSGKSAVTRLLEVLFYNSYQADQSKFIMDDCVYWRAVLTFDDGVVYTREKYTEGHSLWELKKNDKVVFTNKLANGGFAAMPTVPEVIANYLGVVQEEQTGESLNVRRNTDKLFLINTTGGDNYKILNTILRSDVLSLASKNLNDTRNKKVVSNKELETRKEVLNEQYDNIEVANKDILLKTLENVQNTKTYNSQLKSMEDVLVKFEIVSGSEVQPELVYIDMKQLEGITELMVLFDKMSVTLQPNLEVIDLDRLKSLSSLVNLYEASSVGIPEELSVIDTDRVRKLTKLMSLYNDTIGDVLPEMEQIEYKRCSEMEMIIKLLKEVKKNKLAYDETNKECNEKSSMIEKYAEKYNIKKCDNCGSLVM